MTLARRGAIVALAMMSLLIGLFGVQVATAPPAEASHTCYVELWEHIDYGGSSIWFPCPEVYSNGTSAYPALASLGCCGWDEKVSSLKVHHATCDMSTLLYEHESYAGYVFGGTNGLPGVGTWNIADLRPYGWNDRISSLKIVSNIWNC